MESSTITTSEHWLGGAKETPKNVFVVHGEAGVAESFSDMAHQKLGWNSRAPKDGDSLEL
jgi:metallo-beta-lactamase family protein